MHDSYIIFGKYLILLAALEVILYSNFAIDYDIVDCSLFEVLMVVASNLYIILLTEYLVFLSLS